MLDLYSDTLTLPTSGMKEAMLNAPLGDEQRGEDPTTLELESKICQLTGQQRALFLPSATMANQIAIQLHCGPGDELLAAENSHVLCYESGGAAFHARASVRGIPTWTGIFGSNAIRDRLRPDSPHSPSVRLVVVENTTNQGGGRPWTLPQLDEVINTTKEHQLRLHLDGSRLFNAAVAQGLATQRLCQSFDTVTLCFSKGLGCPVGAALALSDQLYGRARKLKQVMGGAMRQSGILAAAAIYALNHHVDRLAQDHQLAQNLAAGLGQLAPLIVEQFPNRTNMIFFELPHQYSGDDFSLLLEQENIRVSRVKPQRFRAVTHLNLSPQDAPQIIEGFRNALSKLRAQNSGGEA